MTDLSGIHYPKMDVPEILMSLFHPRPEWPATEPLPFTEDIFIPAEADVILSARFHLAGSSAPNILFFHGNGEIVADYDDVGPMYRAMGANFLTLDYRGDGRSTGEPTVTGMMKDAHVAFEFVKKWLTSRGYGAPIIVMGRSLGSAPALELSANYHDRIEGLIVESGFARTGSLLRLLGVSMRELGMREEEGFRNLEKIKAFPKSTLIIHAEKDHLIPFSEGQMLFNASPSSTKKLLMVPGANHNDILSRGLKEYLKAVHDLLDEVKALKGETGD